MASGFSLGARFVSGVLSQVLEDSSGMDLESQELLRVHVVERAQVR